jgi:hypothetical protein
MALRYQHHPLKSSRSFRVLRLKPSREGKLLYGDILEVSLVHPPVYEALSYAWGSPDPTHGLLCDGKVLPITTTCAGAHERLRDQRKTKTFWVDSICIDQSSLGERNHQVGLMMEIYSSASRVIVDLGDATLASDAVIDFLSRLAAAKSRTIPKLFNWLSGKGTAEVAVLTEIQRKLKGLK